MPFTLAHPAAVLPFGRQLARWRLLSAALIGSMVPDFGWFMPWRPARFETHSVNALLSFCLPVGLTAYWLFQRVIRRPVLELLPSAAYMRWHGSSEPADYESLKQWVLAACGVLGGAITHLIWDAFTHEGARGLRLFPGSRTRHGRDQGPSPRRPAFAADVNSLIGVIIGWSRSSSIACAPGRAASGPAAAPLAAGRARDLDRRVRAHRCGVQQPILSAATSRPDPQRGGADQQRGDRGTARASRPPCSSSPLR